MPKNDPIITNETESRTPLDRVLSNMTAAPIPATSPSVTRLANATLLQNWALSPGKFFLQTAPSNAPAAPRTRKLDSIDSEVEIDSMAFCSIDRSSLTTACLTTCASCSTSMSQSWFRSSRSYSSGCLTTKFGTDGESNALVGNDGAKPTSSISTPSSSTR